MARRRYTVSDDHGIVATFWTAEVAHAAVRRWTLAGHRALRILDNRTGTMPELSRRQSCQETIAS
jgi:hypothetical protein